MGGGRFQRSGGSAGNQAIHTVFPDAKTGHLAHGSDLRLRFISGLANQVLAPPNPARSVSVVSSESRSIVSRLITVGQLTV